MDAVARLTPSQLAEYTLASDTLRDSEKAGKVFGSLDSHNIGEFMDAFNAAAQQVCKTPLFLPSALFKVQQQGSFSLLLNSTCVNVNQPTENARCITKQPGRVV